MATVVLTAAAAAIVGPGGAGFAVGSATFTAWGAVASAVGAYIDSAVILPRLFKDKTNGELGSSTVQTVDEGSPFRYAIGPETRIPGFLAWQPRELEFVEGQQGGKGGGSSKEPTPDKYFTDGHWTFTRVPEGVTPIHDITRLWMDAKVRYNTDAVNPDARSNGYEIREQIVYGPYVSRSDPNNPGQFITDRRVYLGYDIIGLTAEPDPNDPGQTIEGVTYDFDDFTRGGYIELINPADPRIDTRNSFYSRHQIALVGRTTSNLPYMRFWWGRPTGISGPLGAGDLWESDLSINGGSFVTPGDMNPAHGTEFNVLRITQEQGATDPGLANSFRVRNGGRNHDPISTIEDHEAFVPHYNSWSCMTINRLALQDFGNRLPNLEALVVNDENPVPLARVLVRILYSYCGMPLEEFDTTQIPNDILVRGYWWEAPYDGKTVIQPLLLAYDLMWYEADGRVIIKPRELADEVTIPEGDLGIRQDNRNVDIPSVDFRDESEFLATKEVNIRYTDPDSGYAIGDMTYRRPDLEIGESVSVDLTRLTLTAAEARKIAQRLVWQGAMYRREVEFTVGPNWGHLTAGTYANVTAQGKTWRFMLTNVTRGDDGRMRCTGYVDDGVLEDLPLLGTDLSGAAGSANTGFYIPPDTVTVAMKIPAVFGLDKAERTGIYLATSTLGPATDWRGGTYYQRYPTATSTTWEEIGSNFRLCTMGRLLDPIPTGVPDVLSKYAQTIRVEIFDGELETVTLDELLEGQNRLYVNDEILGFQDAVLTGGNVGTTRGGEFTIDSGYFVRGLYGTEHHIQEHPAGSIVVLLDSEFSLFWNELPNSSANQSFEFRMVPAGADLDDVEGIFVDRMQWETARQYTPLPVEARKDPFQGQQPVDWVSTISLPTQTYVVNDVVGHDYNNTGYKTWVAVADSGSGTGFPNGVEPGTNGAVWVEIDISPIEFDWSRRVRYPIPIILRNDPPSLEDYIHWYELTIFDNPNGPGPGNPAPVRTEIITTGSKYSYSFLNRRDDGNTAQTFYCRLRQLGGFQNSEYVDFIAPNVD